MTRFTPLLCLAPLLPACVVVADDPDPYASYLTVDWSVDGVQYPDECFRWDADEILIEVSTADGGWYADYFADCAAYATSIPLSPGRYYAVALLVDGAAPRTTEVDLGYFTLYGDDELVIPIDFPADSFY